MSKNNIDNKKIYNENWESWVDMKIYGPASKWLRYLIRYNLNKIDTSKIKSILDVGSGEGTITYYLAKWCDKAKVLGIDFSEQGILCAKKNYNLNNLNFIHDDKSVNLNYKYDMVTAYEVLEHVDNWKELLGKMADASNRYIMLSFPTGRMRKFEVNVGHYRNFKKGEVELFLKEKGFKEVNVFYAGFPFYNPLYREVCNITNSASNSFTTGKYGLKQKLTASVIFFFFNYLSTKYFKGDQFCGLFEKNEDK